VKQRNTLEDALRAVGTLPDAVIDLCETALVLGAFDRPGIGLEPYRAHVHAMIEDTAASAARRSANDLEARIACLNEVLYREYGYAGDAETYDAVENANLLHVIDRRVGLPVSLGILYIQLARAQGWPVDGLAFPGHFLIRLDQAARRAIIDPFHEGRPLEAEQLRDLLKHFLGAAAELKPDYYAAIGNRDILMRLLNNVKTRALHGGDPRRAADILGRMVMLAPQAGAAWRELGLVEAHLGNLKRAMSTLETFLTLTTDANEQQQTHALLKRLRGSLN
jgi:regulator of sirC expression with transglutaminase-like and TPR domain